MKKFNENDQFFCRTFGVSSKNQKGADDAQLVIMIITQEDKSIIEEISKRQDTIIKNCIDFSDDEKESDNPNAKFQTHREKAAEYFLGYNKELAQLQYNALCARIEEFLNPDGENFLNPDAKAKDSFDLGKN